MHLNTIPWNFLSVFQLFNIFLDPILKLREKSELFFFLFSFLSQAAGPVDSEARHKGSFVWDQTCWGASGGPAVLLAAVAGAPLFAERMAVLAVQTPRCLPTSSILQPL